MYLKSLSLRGFKSFADKTQLLFDSGLNVVVGPNGSGKSNISDAILWVLGEQSAKMLRGQAMDDVIFSGSSARSAVSVAEVTLVLDNSDGVLPLEFSEVGITRRMYRSGDSEYLINNAPARLRDIQDILHDSGLGKDTHSIISQGKLDSILAGRPEERRELIEETAGISKHRRRKERAERKLLAMDNNLLRAKDIKREITRQLRPLERQVNQTKRYRELKETLAHIQTTLAVDDLRQLKKNYEAVLIRDKENSAAIEIAEWKSAECQDELNRYQALLEQKGIFVGNLGEQRRRMHDVLGRIDSDSRLLEEKGKNMIARLSEMRMNLSTMDKQKADAVRELNQLNADFAGSRGEVAAIKQQVEKLSADLSSVSTLRARLSSEVSELSQKERKLQQRRDKETLAYSRLKDQIETAQTQDTLFKTRLERISEQQNAAKAALSKAHTNRAALESDLIHAQQERASAEEQLAEVRLSLVRSEERLKASQEKRMHQEADIAALLALEKSEGQKNAFTKTLLQSPLADRIQARLADVFEVKIDYETLLESFLADILDALVVGSAADIKDIASHTLAAERKGTATFFLQDQPSLKDVDTAAYPGICLLSQIEPIDEQSQNLLRVLFSQLRLVNSIDEALAFHTDYPHLTFITRDAAAVFSDGRIVLYGAHEDKGPLERKRELRGLQKSLPDLIRDQNTAASDVASFETQLRAAREKTEQTGQKVHELSGEMAALASELERLSVQISSFDSEYDQVMQARSASAEKISAAKKEISEHKQSAQEAEEELKDCKLLLKQKSSERFESISSERHIQAQLSEAKLKLATIIERNKHFEDKQRQLNERISGLGTRIDTTNTAAASLDIVRLRVEPLHKRYELIRDAALAWASRLKDRASLAESDSNSLKKTISDAKQALDNAVKELEDTRAHAATTKVELGKIEVEVNHALESISATGISLEEALQIDPLDNREALEQQAKKIYSQLENFGPVNEAALSEYEALKARSDYIDAQLSDLEHARAALHKITRAIERKMKDQFLRVFDKVNANFSEIFNLLFPGGKAYLELSDPDHLDTTGVEISAQPRGKRLFKMTLMSGGEKSLTALALLFAAYKTRTVPFYVFDEIEAALDDANLTKLLTAIDQLKNTTQLIVITHQRRTMEQADVLYGVSMHSDGVSHVISQRLEQNKQRG